MTSKEQTQLQELSGGKSAREIAGALLAAYDPENFLQSALPAAIAHLFNDAGGAGYLEDAEA